MSKDPTETQKIYGVEDDKDHPVAEGCRLGCGLLIALTCAGLGIRIFYWIMGW